MFTGLIEAVGRVAAVEPRQDDSRIRIEPGAFASELKAGESIAVSGACLTVTEPDASGFWADVSGETLAHTTLSERRVGDGVNLERALAPTTRLGGHFVAGHVDGVGEIMARTPDGRSVRFSVRVPDELATDHDYVADACRMAWEAGADVLFVEAPTEREQMERVCREAPGPLLANLAAKGKTPPMPAEELAEIGYDLAIYPSDSFKAALKTIQDTYETLIDERSQENVLDGMVEWGERDEITEMGDVEALEDKYAAAKERYADAYDEL
jgi:hypothetical protein